jgi:hypothetical protein
MKNIFFNNFFEIIKPIENKYTNLLNIFKLNEKWKSEIFFELEIKKSYIKSILRYCPETNHFQEIINETLKKRFNDFEYTQLYPLLHLSNDKIEAGDFHYDQGGDQEVHTLWIAISDYNYKGLAVMPFHIKNKFFSKLIIKSGIAKVLSRNLSIRKGDTFLWPGSLIHAGNFNNSELPSIAMQMRIINKKYNIKYKKNKNYSEENEIKDFAYFHNLIYSILEISTENSSLEEKFKKLNYNIKNKKKIENNHVLSFALSILSQRLIFSKKFELPKPIFNESSFLMLDFASLALGSYNSISIKRIINYDNSLRSFLSKTFNFH